MQLPIGEWFESLRVGIGLVPPALIAIVLLGGPTAGWLLYHFVVQPRGARSRGFDRARFWVCPSCRSVNDFRLRRCYRCDAQPAGDDLEVIDAQPSGPRRMTPVGPGLNFGAPTPMPRPRPVSSLETPAAGWETGMSAWVAEVEDEEEWDEELEEDRAALPDLAAMTEVIEAPGRRRSARPPTSIPVGPGRPAVARPRRVAIVGQTAEPDDDPPAA